MDNRPALSPAAGLLADARRRAGLSQRGLAALAGTSPSAIAEYEAGRRDPTVNSLIRLVEACGMELRMVAERLDRAALAQRSRDAEVGEEQAWRNAARIHAEVV